MTSALLHFSLALSSNANRHCTAESPLRLYVELCLYELPLLFVLYK